MPDPTDLETVSSDPSSASQSARSAVPEVLRPLVERLRGLQSAWVVLAPSCLSTSGQEIVQAGRVARKELATLAQHAGAIDAESFDRMKTRLDWLEHAICTMAFGVATAQLQNSLPACLHSGRRGLLDLLDILAQRALERPESLAPKLGTLDYIITLLCTDGDTQGRVMPHDPVMLTPTFQSLCESAGSEFHAQLSEVEAEFFAAANLAADLKDEVLLRGLRARKADLGRSYFAPRMLRAIVTYNVALQQCVAAEVWDSRDWGRERPATLSEIDEAPSSLFDSSALRSIHQAVLRRIAGASPETSAVGRVAWALDLEFPNRDEVAMLTGGSVAPSDLGASIVMVGLLCRSLNVLAIELQDIDIDPDTVSDKWVKELDELQKEHVRESIAAGDAYDKAVQLSELRNKFLYAAMRDVYKDHRGNTPRRAPAPSQAEERKVKKEARALASKALTEKSSPRRACSDEEPVSWRDWQWRLIVPAGATAVLALVVGLHQLGLIDLFGRNLDRWGGSELASVSPHLARGHRNGGGAGVAFVGTIDQNWLALGKEKQRVAAEELVAGLREQGVVQVMIYDDQKRLRIQALGDTVRML